MYARRPLFWRIALLVWIVVGLMATFIAPAYATAPVSTERQTFNTAAVLTYFVGVFLPLVVAFFTKQHWKAWVKGVLLLFLSALSSVIGQWLEAQNSDIPFQWQTVIVTAILTFAAGVLAHTGAWGAGDDGGIAKQVQRKLGVK